MKSQRVDTWAASIPDRSGALANKLKALAAGGINLELVIARRLGDEPGKGVVFVTPIKGAKQVGAASGAGFTRTSSLHTLRVEGADKIGQASRVATSLAEHGLNLRAFRRCTGKFVCYVAFDTGPTLSCCSLRAQPHLSSGLTPLAAQHPLQTFEKRLLFSSRERDYRAAADRVHRHEVLPRSLKKGFAPVLH
jgi:hypothetical protein